MKKAKSKSTSKSPKQPTQTRNLALNGAVGARYADWPLYAQTSDGDMWANQFVIRQRSRDLFQLNPYFVSGSVQTVSNCFGDAGMQLRMRIKETEDRVLYSPDEKWAFVEHERRYQRVLDWAATKNGRPAPKFRLLGADDRGQATIQVGQPDLYACKVIQEAWAEWKEAQYCDVRGARDYNTLCQIRLVSAMRDGDHFIRMIRDPKINKFGFALQHINAELCDYWFNTTLANGNVVRMGIEYQWHSWGLGKPVAYYFLKQSPMDWQWSQPGMSGGIGNLGMYDRVKAEEIIHYARYTANDSTRPWPWCVSVFPKAWQLDKFEEAEVVAARVSACKMAFLISDLVPEGGFTQGAFPAEMLPDPKKSRALSAEPGSLQALDWGVKVQDWDPKHPSQNFENFRRGMVRSIASGMMGATYSGLANDYEGINFSAGKLERLNITEMWELIQAFDISTAERPIFEAWLEMALMTGAIPLPFAKWQRKYARKSYFQGKRWEGVQPDKDSISAAMDIANKLTSRTRVCMGRGLDFNENLLELAEEEMNIEALGMDPMTTAQTPPPVAPKDAAEPDADDEGDTPPPKTNGKKNGRHVTLHA